MDDMGGSREYEEILEFINSRITPHLKQALRAVGETRPDDPVAFIAEAFVSGHIPDGAEGGPRTELSLSAYLAEHQVVAIVQQAVGACAAAQPAPENPLQFVGQYIQDRHVGASGAREEYQAMDEDDIDDEEEMVGEPEPRQDVTPTDQLWVGSIPLNLVGGDSSLASVLNINANKSVTSLFSQFGKVKHSTVRVKAGVNKSWALITYEDIASAIACYNEGITVMDEKYEEIKLRVSYADVEGQLKKNSSGVLAQLSQKHEEDLLAQVDDETTAVWVGGLPRECVTGEVGAEGATLDSSITDQLNGYGEVLSATVRVKDGDNKSWALVTFHLAPDAGKALRGGLTARRSDGSVHPLILKAADVERELSKQGTGALARMAKKHEEEVEAARALMRQMWSSMRSSDLKNPAAGGGGRHGVGRKLARYKAFDVPTVDEEQADA